MPTVKLTEIFRQNEGSRIVNNAHLINKGEHPNLGENKGDFFPSQALAGGKLRRYDNRALRRASADKDENFRK